MTPSAIVQDELGTHLDWELEAVTPRMIDWFWSNMEKGFVLWHPREHQPLSWAVPVRHGSLVGAVHLAPQTWSDGVFRNLYIRFEDPGTLPPAIQGRVVYEHCVVAAGLGFGEESLAVDEPMGYRVHQWQKTDAGVVGRSSAIGRARPETHEEGRIWAKHCAEEIGSWAVFLPDLYRLYRVVESTAHNPFADLSLERVDGRLRYRSAA